MRLTVGFSTTNSFVSRTIRWFLGAKVSHCYVRFYDPYLETEMVFHADWPGVILESFEQFKHENKVMEEFDIEDERIKRILTRNMQLLRKRYDYWHIVKWAIAITFKRWVKNKFLEPPENPKKIICVDLVVFKFLRQLVTVPNEDFQPKSFLEWMRQVYEQHNWKRTAY